VPRLAQGFGEHPQLGQLLEGEDGDEQGREVGEDRSPLSGHQDHPTRVVPGG